jgi:hypothetical protein
MHHKSGTAAIQCRDFASRDGAIIRRPDEGNVMQWQHRQTPRAIHTMPTTPLKRSLNEPWRSYLHAPPLDKLVR